MSNGTRLAILAALLLAAAGGITTWAVTRRPIVDSNCGTLVGTLKSADEKYAGKNSRYLEFYIDESPIRFRVPADGYLESFKGDAFFANVKPGTRITLTAEKSELANPMKPMLDPVPTVFVYGLKDDQMEYSTLAGRKKWEATNRFYGYIVAIVFAVIGAGMGLKSFTAN